MAHDDQLAVVLPRQRGGSAMDARDAAAERMQTELAHATAETRSLWNELQVCRAQRSALQDQLTAVTAELDHVREQLGRTRSDLEDAHAEQVAVLSHELRNPLALLGCSLEVLDRVAPGGELARRALAVSRRQFSHMRRMVEDLLDVSRVRHGKIQLRCERLDLGDLVRHAVEDHRDAFGAAGIALDLTVAPAAVVIDGDPTRLSQVLGNLLHNATKFTPRGGAARISVAEDRASSRATIQIQDTGQGIDADILPHVFDPFVQADTTPHRNKGGLGLGLAVVRGVIEAHGGLATVASQGHGHGTTFTLSLPLATGPLPHAFPGEPVEPTAKWSRGLDAPAPGR